MISNFWDNTFTDDDEDQSREARRIMLPDELDPPASNSNTEQSQVSGTESPITEVPDFTRDQAKSQVSKLKKKNGNDLAVIALILTVSTFFPLAFFSLPPFSTILHLASLMMVIRMQTGKLTPTPGWVTVGIITGAINVYFLLMQLGSLLG